MNTIKVKFEQLDTMTIPMCSVVSTLDGDPICEAIKLKMENIEYVKHLVANKRARALVDTNKIFEVEYKFY